MSTDLAITRLAAFGGSYGNVPALTACLDDADALGAQARVFLGDAIGCCGASGAVLEVIRARCTTLVAGNHEQEAVARSGSCGCGYASADDERLSCQAFQVADAGLSDADRAWLATWPERAFIATPRGRVLLCHGSPGRTNEFLYDIEVDDQRLDAWLTRFAVIGFICTHSGLPWIRRLRGGRFAVNCGTSGKPDHDGDPAVHYAFLDFAGEDAPRIEIRRVAYDHESWARSMERAGIDPLFVAPVRTGVWTVGIASLPEAERHRYLRAGPGAAPDAPVWALDAARFDAVLALARRLGLLTVAEAAEVGRLLDPDFPFHAAARLADSIHAHVRVGDVAALPHAALAAAGGVRENERPGYVKYAFAGGLNLIFSSILVAEDDRVPDLPQRPRPFLDHGGIDLRREIGAVRAVFDGVPARARRLGWLHVAQGGPGRAVACCHANVAAKHWLYPQGDDRFTRPVEFAFGPLRISDGPMGWDLRPLDPRLGFKPEDCCLPLVDPPDAATAGIRPAAFSARS